MTEGNKLVGTPDQGSLFGSDEHSLQPPEQQLAPDVNVVRLRLHSVVEKARAAQKMPWSEREARMWRIIFPNMAKWLPPEEADQLCFEFFTEIERLTRAA